MKTIGCRKPILAAAAISFAAAAITGCSSSGDNPQGTPEKDGKVGQIGAELMLGSVTVNTVTWTLKNLGTTPPTGWTGDRTGDFDVTGPGSTFTGLITNVPPGSDYDLTFTATSVGATATTGYTCTGHAAPTPFSVSSNQTTLQTVHLNCRSNATQTGKILVNGELNLCPSADDIGASALSAAVGSSINLTAMATDEDSAPSPLAYAFALSAMQPPMPGAGTLMNATSPNASLRCDSPGPVSVTLTVNDGDSTCPEASVQLVLICTGVDACAGVTCPDLGPCMNAGVCDHATGACSAGTPKPVGTSCADSDLCNGAETCDAAGTCAAGTALVCTASDACHTAGTCDPATGCSNPAAADGTACAGGSCQGGVCQNLCTGVMCTAPTCQLAGMCDPSTGMCGATTPAPDGTACDDGNAATFNDRCTAGACAGGAHLCDPAEACCACESMAHGSNNSCSTNLTRCETLTGTTSATSPVMPGVSKATLCTQIVECIHESATHCGASSNGVTDCLCGTNVDATACFGGTFAAMAGDCRDLMAAGAESNSPAQINNVFYDTTFAIGAATSVVETCDQLFCSSQCL